MTTLYRMDTSAGMVVALFGWAISALIIAGFNYPVWSGCTDRPGGKTMKVGLWLGGIAWALAYYLGASSRHFRYVDADLMMQWGVIFTLVAFLASPFVSAAMRGPRGRTPDEPKDDSRKHTCVNASCRHKNRPNARFCARCGRRLPSD